MEFEDLKAFRQKVLEEGADDIQKWVGRQVRDLRKARRMSLQQLNEASGLSIGLLSQIERGTLSPSIRSLQALSKALEVPATWFFNDGVVPPDRERTMIVRRGSGRRLDLPTKGIVKELMSPDLSGALQMLIVTLEPDGTTGSDSYCHPGEECGLVLDGSLDLWVDQEKFSLSAGDAFRFRSNLPHKARNPGKTVTRVVWVTTPPFY